MLKKKNKTKKTQIDTITITGMLNFWHCLFEQELSDDNGARPSFEPVFT